MGDKKKREAMYIVSGISDPVLSRWSKFGHTPTNPVRALTRDDALAYLARLRLPDGQKVLCRQSRLLASKVSASPIECFEITRLDGGPLATIYIALDGRKNSEQPPDGFKLEPAGKV